MSGLLVCSLCFMNSPWTLPEVEEYAVEGKTDDLLYRPSDGFT